MFLDVVGRRALGWIIFQTSAAVHEAFLCSNERENCLKLVRALWAVQSLGGRYSR